MAISPTKSAGLIDPDEPYPISRRYALIAFAMIFALMLSDYLSRQVINAVFPFLKADWSLSDTELGVLVSVVALTIGVTAVPISIIADRIGRVRAVTAMALVWALATVACGLAESFTALLIARALVGLGEAGYGSTGAAILTRAFPARLHSTVMGSYLAASVVGSVLGIVLGGAIAQSYGWQVAFIVMGIFGLIIAVLFPFLVKEPPPIESAKTEPLPIGRVLADLVATRTFVLVALGNGLSMFVQTAYLAWMPSYLNRFYDLDPAKSAYATGLLLLGMSVGMVAGGMVVDRVSRNNPVNRLRTIVIYCLIMGSALIGGLSLLPGVPQFILIGVGMFLSSSFLGPAMAVAGDVTPEKNHATTFGVMSLVTMLLGAAPGPFVTGKLADLLGLDTALLIVPVGALCGGACYFLASRSYARERDALRCKCSEPSSVEVSAST